MVWSVSVSPALIPDCVLVGTKRHSDEEFPMVCFVCWRGVSDGVLCLLTRSLRWCALSAGEEFTMVCFVCWRGVYDGVLCLLTRSLRWCGLSADEEFTTGSPRLTVWSSCLSRALIQD